MARRADRAWAVVYGGRARHNQSVVGFASTGADATVQPQGRPTAHAARSRCDSRAGLGAGGRTTSDEAAKVPASHLARRSGGTAELNLQRSTSAAFPQHSAPRRAMAAD